MMMMLIIISLGAACRWRSVAVLISFPILALEKQTANYKPGALLMAANL